MGFFDIFAIVLWPMIAIGLCLGWLANSWKFRISDSARRWIGVPGIFLAIGFSLSFMLLVNQSVSLLLDWNIFLIVLGVLLFTFAIRHRKEHSRFLIGPIGRAIADQFPRHFRSVVRVERALTYILGTAFLIFGSWCLIGDFVLPHKYAAGIAERVASSTASTSLYVSGQRYGITQDLFDSVPIGQPVWVEYGRASRNIFRIKASNIPLPKG
jgi:hypothetical protein